MYISIYIFNYIFIYIYIYIHCEYHVYIRDDEAVLTSIPFAPVTHTISCAMGWL